MSHRLVGKDCGTDNLQGLVLGGKSFRLLKFQALSTKMEFKSLKNIETSFRQIRLFCIVLVIGCAVVAICSVVFAFRFAEKQCEKIYVLDGGKSLMLALSQDLSQNRPAEAREHVRRFHELFFTLSPEKSAIEHNVKRALLLADKSAYNYYQDFAEKGFYNRLIAGNINQSLQSRSSGRSCLANRVRREIIMMHISLCCLCLIQSVQSLCLRKRCKRCNSTDLCLSSRKHC